MCWECIGYGDDALGNGDPVLEAVEELVYSCGTWQGTAQELVSALQRIDSSLLLQPKSLSRTLNDEKVKLRNVYGIAFSKNRKGNTKLITLESTENLTDMYDVPDDFNME